MNKIIPIALCAIMPIAGIMVMVFMFGGIQKSVVRDEIRKSQNPSGIMLIINDRESEIRRLEMERIRLQAIVDTYDKGYKNVVSGTEIKLKDVGALFEPDRHYNIDDVKSQQDSIKAQLYGSWWRNIYPQCLGWVHSDWASYNIRWDARKSSTKGVEWAREVETNGYFKVGHYPYEEGAYMKLARLNSELSELRSLDNGTRSTETLAPGYHDSRIDTSIGAP